MQLFTHLTLLKIPILLLLTEQKVGILLKYFVKKQVINFL